MINILIILILFISCTSSKDYKINYKSHNIYDISVNPKNILYLCSTPGNPKEPRTFFTVYIVNPQGTATSFYTRRALSLKECKEWMGETQQIMKDAKRVRVIGLQGTEDVSSNLDLKRKSKGKYSIVNSHWIFSRIVTDKGCVGHFGRECSLGFDEKTLYTNP